MLVGFDFGYFDELINEIRALRTRYPADVFILGGDLNADLHSPRGSDERLVEYLLLSLGNYDCVNDVLTDVWQYDVYAYD